MEIITAKNLSFQIAIVEKPSQTLSYYPHSNISLMAFQAGQEQLKNGFSGQVDYSNTTYVVSMAIGIPETPVSLSIDTGSDVTWLQCKPCTDCFKKSNPPFDPETSGTFKNTTCENENCNIFANALSPACDDNRTCQFVLEYGDKSEVRCNMASDYFQLEGINGIRKAFDHRLYFGCAFFAKGIFYETEDGIMGLGQGPFSIISQLDISKFSHCLQLPLTGKTSYVKFGDAARLVGQAAPLIQNKRYRSQYLVNFHSMIVIDDEEEIKLKVPSNIFEMDKNGRGGLVLDFGTTLTRIPEVAFNELCKVIESKVPNANNTAKLFQKKTGVPLYCFEASFNDLKDIGLIFRHDSIDIPLINRQLFFRHYRIVGQKRTEFKCLTVSVSNIRESIFGAYAQANYNIGYDLDNQIVTFDEMRC
ncbi:Aspartic peptidase A1 family protein [Dioscorea alata]|uniref:Aspartic peptidase A1 family protein n=1 Tax=Dioscorea alata TaxID=55571 RepID=A0ACB7UNR3_DIOAL|nr:Aspartic peptidase A1 family protein [Dioscorea alata]